MKCPVCELFGRELRFANRRELDQHSSRFHGLSANQLGYPIRAPHLATVQRRSETAEHPARRLLH
jgi:hypothetical protein